MKDIVMSQVIRISDELYKRLEAHALGFDTPSNVIERILDAFEGITTPIRTDPVDPEIQLASSLEIVYFPDTEEIFKQELLKCKKAYIKLHYTNGTSEIKEWNASKFDSSSSVNGNLRSGYLRGWKEKGIYKAELAVNRNELA
jgi:hypothetical protein